MVKFHFVTLILASTLSSVSAFPLVITPTPTLQARASVATSQTFTPFPVPAEGALQCRPAHPPVSPQTLNPSQYYFAREGALSAISNFCATLVKNKLIMGHGFTSYQESTGYTDMKGQALDLTVAWTRGGTCESVDFGKAGMLETCKSNMGRTVDGCDTVKGAGGSNGLWKQGGGFTIGCLTWAVGRLGQP
ncbi:hypothetical protein BGZ60DRAFT_510621 [Tricladium varicosporioides]|nr:hypothetical protein BGZ60DRAFT_510621 [Hymenoscyphus varicosporioides]